MVDCAAMIHGAENVVTKSGAKMSSFSFSSLFLSTVLSLVACLVSCNKRLRLFLALLCNDAERYIPRQEKEKWIGVQA